MSREENGAGRFWIIARDPNCVPERKGPYSIGSMAKTIREFMKARPFSFLSVVTVDEFGVPDVEDAPQALKMLDGRSMKLASRHIARLRSTRPAPHPQQTGAR